MKEINLLIKLYVPDDVDAALFARLDRAFRELSSGDEHCKDNSIFADLADRLDDLVQLSRRAKACGGKDSEDEQ